MTAWGASKGKVLPLVAKIAGGLKKRILTEEQRARLIKAGKTGGDALKRWRDQRAQAPDSTSNEANSIQGGDRPGKEASVFIDRRVGLSCIWKGVIKDGDYDSRKFCFYA
jgi:hypothetical protein